MTASQKRSGSIPSHPRFIHRLVECVNSTGKEYISYRCCFVFSISSC